MAPQNPNVFDSLTRRHGVKVVCGASVEHCSLAAGEVVGHGNILAASKMNSAVVIFLNTVERANELAEKGIVVGGSLYSVLPLSTPSKKVTLSNVPPFIKDETLARELSRYGKLVSPIKRITIGSKSELIKHVISFRRFAYMILNDNNSELERTLTFKIDGFDYVIYVSTDTMKCFGCGKAGHLIRECTQSTDSGNTGRGESGAAARDGEEVEQGTRAEGRDRVDSPHSEADDMEPVEQEHSAASTSSSTTHTTPRDDVSKADSTNISEPGSQGEPAEPVTEDNVSNTQDSTTVYTDSLLGEDTDTAMIDVDLAVLKTPVKRKKNKKDTVMKQARKEEKEQIENDCEELESEVFPSDSPVNVTETWTGKDYSASEIKHFLKLTKNMRMVKICDYFPDHKRIFEAIKQLMSEGCFEVKEVYRLKKIVTKLHSTLSNDGSEMS